MLTWKFASPDEYIPVCDMFRRSQLHTGEIPDILRRVSIPLFLRHLITFYQDSKLCGFITFAFLNEEAESHMPTTGIMPQDWRSGSNFWVADYVAHGDGYKMLRMVTKGLGIKKCRYFRDKQKQIREVRPI